jgi:hypothetical protein
VSRTLKAGDMIVACAHVVLEDGRIRPQTLWEWPGEDEDFFFLDRNDRPVPVAAKATCRSCQCLPGEAEFVALVEISVPPTLDDVILS